MDLKEQIEANRLSAFKHYVEAWKKQDASTVTRNGDLFSYKTKKGKTKTFRATKRNEPYNIRVEGFFFMEVE